MKIQTAAIIDQLLIDDKRVDLAEEHFIELEFSAIDTGGGFKDPILDFSIKVPDKMPIDVGQLVVVGLRNPQQEERKVAFEYKMPEEQRGSNIAINGRLKGDQLSREVIGFVLQLLR
ncbi:hypothetical protein [Fodinibius saliphilus]|uniref:hypothetical protein n=1 Tax=Fodinibius saliphilus TaxID=1920650 RepID=UPI0011086BEA|nr:hypothetical protein [Fodinibius saliphilus]